MTANVRCAGGGFPGRWWYLEAALAKTGTGKPCGWSGPRRTTNRRNTQHGLPLAQVDVLLRPCPWCGGRVELIPGVVDP